MTIIAANTNTNTNTNTSSATPGQLFDLKQRADGAWAVWTRKSPAELGMVDRASVEKARDGIFTDAEWADFVRQPQFTEPTIWVIAALYETRPSVDAVLALLGVKRRTPRAEGAANSNSSTTKPRRQKVAAQPQALAA
jgi:hypothetical protein